MIKRPVLLLVMLLLAVLAACQKAEGPVTPTPNRDSAQAASTLFAQPTHSSRSTPSPSPANSVELDLNRTVAQMEDAVLQDDPERYLSYIWDGDATFRTEQTRWAEDWHAHPLSVFDITLYGIQQQADGSATARMTILWTRRGSQSAGSSGGATVSAVFFSDGRQWLWGGESWKTLEVEGIRFYYFSDDLLDNRPQAEQVAEFLPDIFNRITHEFGYVPPQTAEIKMYESPATLQTLTRLSIPVMSLWNEPGEAIKITLGPSNTAPRDVDIAREYTRFLLDQMAGGQRAHFPWWLQDGLAEYGASLFRTLSQRNRMLKSVAALSGTTGADERTLFAWDGLGEDSDALSGADLGQVQQQAYSLVEFITSTFGTDRRNAWIQAIAGGQSLDDAAQQALGLSFADLDQQWRAWLPEQL